MSDDEYEDEDEDETEDEDEVETEEEEEDERADEVEIPRVLAPEPETTLETHLAPYVENPLANSQSFAAWIAIQHSSAPTLTEIVGNCTEQGYPESRVWNTLTRALNEGWLELWQDVGPDYYAALSRRAAEDLDIALTTESERWITRRSAEAFNPHIHRLDGEEIAELKEDDRPDPRAMEPWEIAAAHEEAQKLGEPLTDGGHAPTRWHFLGLRVPWPVPPARECPIHGPYLPWNHYCLVCDHSGVDALLPAVALTAKRKAHVAGPLRGGV